MSVLKVKNGNQWDIVPAIKGDPGDPAADESITDDMLVTDGIKTEIEWLWGNQLMDSREGELLHAEDAYTAPAVDISVDGKSTQDGTPAPDAPVEIASVDSPELTVIGKNITNFDFGNAASYPVAGLHSYHYSNPIRLTPNTTYILSQVGAAATNGYFIVKAFPGNDANPNIAGTILYLLQSGTWKNSVTFTTGTAGLIRFAYTNIVSLDAVAQGKFQLELGSTATSYEPYLGNTASLLPDGYSLRSLPDGTKDELHLSYLRPSTREGWAWYSRELVKRVGSLLFPEISWTYREAGVDSTGQAQSRFTCRLNAFGLSAGIRPTNSFCSAYAVQNTMGDRNTIFGDGTIYQLINYASLYQDGVNDSRFNNVADFLAANENTVIMSALITPTTETLDPIELPIMPSRTVNVWSDPATNLKMTYIQDSNLIIENLEATIADIATS